MSKVAKQDIYVNNGQVLAFRQGDVVPQDSIDQFGLTDQVTGEGTKAAKAAEADRES